MLIEVFETEKSRIKWYYLIAYGLPMLIVGISGTLFPQGYGSDRYCWLRSDNYIIYTFIGPVSIVLVVCTSPFYLNLVNQETYTYIVGTKYFIVFS